jgi:predicted O-methyltransferase YrrM
MQRALRQRLEVIRRAVIRDRDPRLILDYARLMRAGRRDDGGHAGPPPGPVPGALTPEEGRREIAARGEPWDEGPAVERLRAFETPADPSETEGAARLAGDTSLGELAYSVVRTIRPVVVIETGVAQGTTSAYVLAGLEDNGSGALHSIDLPPAELVASDRVGAAIPPDLRARWTYHWGDSRRLLPKVLQRTRGGRRLFIHDSDHSYGGMRWELEQAWTALGSGDVIMADDVHLHGAFADVAASVGVEPRFFTQQDKAGSTGLLVKP